VVGQGRVGEGDGAGHGSSHSCAAPQRVVSPQLPIPAAAAEAADERLVKHQGVDAAAAAAAAEGQPGGHQAADNPWASFLVPREVLEDGGDVVDVVAPDSTRAMCFTKGYSRNIKGAGSLVATVPPGTPGADPGWYLAGGVHCVHRVLTGAGSKKDVDTNRAVRLALAEAWATLAPRYMTPR
jgi:hypothetical protein